MATDTDKTKQMPEPEQVLALRLDGDPVLRKKARPVKTITPELRVFAQQMIASVMAHNGIGLAAPQVGRSIRMIALNTGVCDCAAAEYFSPGEMLLLPRLPMVLINPEILSFSRETESGNEGCLSVPKIYADVVRARRVVLKAATLDGQTFEVECGGLLSRCVQHEIDHLDGILFVDRLIKTEFEKIAADITALEAQTRRQLRTRAHPVSNRSAIGATNA